MVHKFQNACQVKTGRNMVKSSSPNTPNTCLISLCPRTHASLQTCHHSASSVLTVRISCCIITVFVFRKPLFIVIMVPKCKSIDAGSASKPKRSRDVLSISEKLEILSMIEIEKKWFAEMARLYDKNESSIREVLKNEEKIRVWFSVAPQIAKVTATARDKVLVKVEKALNFWVEKHNFSCLFSALKEKHDFYCSVIPWNCTWYCTVQVLYFFIAVSSLEH